MSSMRGSAPHPAGGTVVTAQGGIIGSPRYMAPELLVGAEPSVATDIYALGVSLYEAATNTEAFGAPSLERVLRRVAAGDAPRVRTVVPSVPALLESAIHAAMPMDPAGRPPDTRALAAALSACEGAGLARALLEATRRMPAPAFRQSLIRAGVALAAGGVFCLALGAAFMRVRRPPPVDIRVSAAPLPVTTSGGGLDSMRARFVELKRRIDAGDERLQQVLEHVASGVLMGDMADVARMAEAIADQAARPVGR